MKPKIDSIQVKYYYSSDFLLENKLINLVDDLAHIYFITKLPAYINYDSVVYNYKEFNLIYDKSIEFVKGYDSVDGYGSDNDMYFIFPNIYKGDKVFGYHLIYQVSIAKNQMAALFKRD